MSGALDRRSNADNWKSRQRLFGKRIVITRARSQVGELARRIEELEERSSTVRPSKLNLRKVATLWQLATLS